MGKKKRKPAKWAWLLNLLLLLSLAAVIAISVSERTESTVILDYNGNEKITIRNPIRIVNTKKLRIKGITIHETANYHSYADAEWHNTFLDTTSRKVIWHYSVDDKQIINTYPDSLQGWHGGPTCNETTLGIEICVYKGIDRDLAESNAKWLIKHLRDKYPGIYVQKHRDCANTKTLCPAGISDQEWKQFLLTL